MKDYMIDGRTGHMEPAVQEHKVERHEAVDKPGRGIMKRLPKMIVILLICLAFSAMAFYLPQLIKGKDSQAQKEGKDRPVPVEVATAYAGSLPIEIHTIGNVLPYSVVNVTPQVGGQLVNVYFKQGDLVKKGQLLFQIDPRPYKAALDQALGTLNKDKAMMKQAQANLAKDEAQINTMKANLNRDVVQQKYANTEMSRYTDLANQGAVSNEQRDQMRTNALAAQATVQASSSQVANAQAAVEADRAAIETARGTVEADQAAVDNARIQLGFTQIRSPIDGRTSSLNVYQGNVVSANSNNNVPLVTIDQVQPIYVNFTVPEEYLDELRQSKANGTLKTTVRVEGIRNESFVGDVSFLEHTINTTTGTIMMRATLANKENRLYTGQYVDVIVDMPSNTPSVCIPSQAVQNTQNGQSVYVVAQNNTVELRPIKVLRTRRGIAAVSQGIKPGEVIVTDGIMSLKPGAKVQVVSQNGAAAGGRRRGGGGAGGAGGAGDTLNQDSSGVGANGLPPGAGGSDSGSTSGLSTNYVPGIGGPGTGGGDPMNPADSSRGTYGPVQGDENASFGQASGGIDHRVTGSESPGSQTDVRVTGTGSPGSRIDDPYTGGATGGGFARTGGRGMRGGAFGGGGSRGGAPLQPGKQR